MKVNIHVDQLANVIQQFQGNKWQASLQTAGAFDPAAGLGVNFRFGSKSIFSGVHDPKLDTLFAQATSTLDTAKRQQLYNQAAAVHQPERLRAVPVPGQRLEHRGEERVRARADHAAPRLRGAAGDPLGAGRVHWPVTVQSTEPCRNRRRGGRPGGGAGRQPARRLRAPGRGGRLRPVAVPAAALQPAPAGRPAAAHRDPGGLGGHLPRLHRAEPAARGRGPGAARGGRHAGRGRQAQQAAAPGPAVLHPVRELAHQRAEPGTWAARSAAASW